MDPSRRVMVNSLSGTSVFLLQLVIAFLLSPIVVRQLGNRDYGIWDIMLGLVGYSRVLEFGIGPAVIYFTALSRARDDRQQMLAIFNSALLSMLALGVLTVLLFAAASLRSEQILSVQPGDVTHLSVLFLLVGLTVGIELPGGVFAGNIRGLQRHYVLNIARHVFLIAQSILIYLALTRWPGSGLVWIAAIYLGTTLVEYGFYAAIVLVLDDNVKLRFSSCSWKILRQLYSYGLKSFVLLVAHRIRMQSMPLVIAHVIGVSQVVFFSIPNRLVEYALYFALNLGLPLIPFFTDLTTRATRESTLKAWLGLSRLLQLVLMWIPLALFMLGGPFIRRWMGTSYADNGTWILRCLCALLVVYALAPHAMNFLVSIGKHGRIAISALILGALNVIASIVLAKMAGLRGVALAFSVFSSATFLHFMLAACRSLELPLWEHLWRSAARFVLPLAGSGAAFAWLQTLWTPLTYGMIVTQGIAAGVVYLVPAWFVALTADDRRRVLALLKRSS